MKRRSLLQGGLAGLAGLLVAKTVGAVVPAPTSEDSELLGVFLRAGDCAPGCPGETIFSCGEYRCVDTCVPFRKAHVDHTWVEAYNDHGHFQALAPRRELSKPLTEFGIDDTFGTLTFYNPLDRQLYPEEKSDLSTSWITVAMPHATFVSRDGRCWKCLEVKPDASASGWNFTCRLLQPWEQGYDLKFND